MVVQSWVKTVEKICILLLAVGCVSCAPPSSKKFKKASQFQCPFEYGLYANPNNCRRFYMCNGGQPYDTPCPSPLYFDDAKKLCVYKSKNLVCGPVEMTTPAPTTADPLASPHCAASSCKLPDCFCSGDGARIPGGMTPKETPQMVLLAFSGALNGLNADPYGQLLNESRVNANRCPIKATFFVSHEYTSYFHVQKLYGQGHEMAVQSISQREEEWWPTASSDDWIEEVVGMKEILRQFANISNDDLLGMRAPFLKPGGNTMMSTIYDYGLEYDSSLAAPASDVPLWPYTLDFRMPHRCLSTNCPTRSFPGIWELPLNTMHVDDGSGGSCVLLDQCVFPQDPEVIYDFLLENFLRHYDTNRAPFVLNLHVNWVTDENKVAALDAFIDHLLESYPDVWFVTMQQALAWMRNPTPIGSIANLAPWSCETRRVAGCNIPRSCAVKLIDGPRKEIRYMQTCGKCPARYPWLGNIRGTREGQMAKDLVKKVA